MKLYRWQGIDHSGLRTRGEYAAENRTQVKQALNRQQVTPLRITREIKLQIFGREKITFQDVTDFSREMAIMLTAGISVAAALAVISDSAAKTSLRLVTKALQKRVESGQLLSQALQSHPGCFDEIFCSLVQVGEQAGKLDNILNDVTLHREKIIALKRKIRKALFYPVVVLLVALVVTTGLMVFVIPEFEHLFRGLGAQLPLFTRIVMRLADQFRNYGWLVILLFLGIFLLLKTAIRKSSGFRELCERILLCIPLIGSSMRNTIFARCFSTLATALQAGVPLLEALDLTVNVAGLRTYKHAFLDLSNHIKSGQAIHVSMNKMQTFPARVVQMITIGEESGRLENMLHKLSDYFEKQVDYTVHNLSQLLEPLIMIFLCVLIGGLVVAMYLPIFLLGAVI